MASLAFAFGRLYRWYVRKEKPENRVSAMSFVPIAFVGDVTGELFRPFALTTTIALLSSLVVSLTIVPVLAFWFLRDPRLARRGHRAPARRRRS